MSTLSISMMAFGFAVLLAAMIILPLQAVLAFLLVRENRKLVNGADSHAKIEKNASAIVALKSEIALLGDTVATFGNRAAVRAKRAKTKDADPPDELPVELFGVADEDGGGFR